jgi:hypothetical protein
MKCTPLAITLLMIGAAFGLHAQTSSILIKSGDTINGTSSNSAILRSFGNVTMNDLGGVAFQGFATETNRITNAVTVTNIGYATNFVPWTNFILTTNFVSSTNAVVTRVVTNVISVSTNYVIAGVTNSFTNTYPQYGYQTNYVVTNRPVVSSTPVLTNRPVVTLTNIATTTNRATVTTTSYSGIWASDTNGTLNLMIRSGQPTKASNTVIASFTDPVINNNGAAAFIGYSMVTNPVTTTNGAASNVVSSAGTIYLTLQGSTNLINIASVGAPAPGTSGAFTSFSNLALPDVGGVIFVGMAGTNQGVWVQNSDSTVHLVALKGQSINVGGSNKVISNFNLMNYGYPGVTRSYSQDTGVLTYQAYFTDGTSAAVRVNR